MAFQLVKHKMAGGCHLMEILYGRKFSIEELSSQPIREISAQCLIYDGELEQEYIRQQEEKSKGSGMLLGSKNVNEILYGVKHPKDSEAIVTLLTIQEFEGEVCESTDHN